MYQSLSKHFTHFDFDFFWPPLLTILIFLYSSVPGCANLDPSSSKKSLSILTYFNHLYHYLLICCHTKAKLGWHGPYITSISMIKHTIRPPYANLVNLCFNLFISLNSQSGPFWSGTQHQELYVGLWIVLICCG